MEGKIRFVVGLGEIELEFMIIHKETRVLGLTLRRTTLSLHASHTKISKKHNLGFENSQ